MLRVSAVLLGLSTSLPLLGAIEERDGVTIISSEHVEIRIGPDATLASFVDAATGEDLAAVPGTASLASVVGAGKTTPASAATFLGGGRVRFEFGETGTEAVLGFRPQDGTIICEVLGFTGEGIEELVFCDMALGAQGSLDEPFAACLLALNLQTNVDEFPGPNRRLQAHCYARFGFEGARVALVACPTGLMRDIIKTAVEAAPEIPTSSVGGPWAMDGPLNRSSYLFDFGNLTEDNVDEWIERVRSVGFTQVQFHGGGSFRFGDCALSPAIYPRGTASLRTITDKLHEAGICAGMQPYAFFIDKRCPWVTPVPDPRLAKDATFTLAEGVSAEADVVPVVESTESMSTITGFFERNSVTLHVDDELIVYTGISKEAPFAFTGCQRGALGTQASAHDAGAKVGHLKECFGLFVPDPETTLLEEVAVANARLFNECGFDGIYFDALDGEDILGGRENGWHHGARYVYEVWKRLERPAIMEMSTFHHHLWYVRSRMGAWDHPNRAHKRFIDLHVRGNESNARMFLPGNLGWWAFKTWSGHQAEPTYPDDVEYLCAKALATDSGLSMTTYDPNSPGQERLARIMRRYELLRQAGTVSEETKALLREPGAEFAIDSLEPDAPAVFRPVMYQRHRVTGLEAWQAEWMVENPYADQALALRIEALHSVTDVDPVTLIDFADAAAVDQRGAADGVTVDLTAGAQSPDGEPCGRIQATSSRDEARGAWAKLGVQFPEPLNLQEKQGLAVWVKGDGKGEVLNFQLHSPSHLSHGLREHYVVVDFEGWRRFQLVEPDAQDYEQYGWPYGGSYSIYREMVLPQAVAGATVWIGNLAPAADVDIELGPLQAVPLIEQPLVSPSVRVEGSGITFPVTMPTGSYLELSADGESVLYGRDGAVIQELKLAGALPWLGAGEKPIEFSCDTGQPLRPRAYVTIIARGEPVD